MVFTIPQSSGTTLFNNGCVVGAHYEGCDWELTYEISGAGSAQAATAWFPVPNPKFRVTTTGATTASYGDWYPIYGNTCTGGTTATITTDWPWDDCSTSGVSWRYIQAEPLSIRDRMKQIIHNRCAPNILVRDSKRQALRMPADIREKRARETLHRVIGDAKFENFLKHGFISIKAKSGLIYQIFPGHGITSVYKQGTMVERLCVVLDGDFPPTDSLIMRYLLILNNEQHFRSCANQHSVPQVSNRYAPAIQVQKSLAEIYQDLKKVA